MLKIAEALGRIGRVRYNVMQVVRRLRTAGAVRAQNMGAGARGQAGLPMHCTGTRRCPVRARPYRADACIVMMLGIGA